MQILQRKIDYSTNNKQPLVRKANLTLRIKPTLKNIPENDQLKLKIPGPLLGRKYYNFSDNNNNGDGDNTNNTNNDKSSSNNSNNTCNKEEESP